MSDSSPLLQSLAAGEAQPEAEAANKAAITIDETIETCIGGAGVAQFLQAFLVTFAWAFDAQQTFISVFTDRQPTWHCTGGAGDSTCSSATSTCGLSQGSWAWDKPKHTSVISEWGLECSGPMITGLPASAYFVGCLAGGLVLSTLADSWLGRKKMLFFASFTMSLTAALTVVSPDVWFYSALRFLCGFARATVGTSALVLSTEIVGKRWRDRVCIAGFFFFTVGFLSLPVMAYIGRESSWRTLYLWTSVPCLFYSISLLLAIQESPRWLLVRGRRAEAIQTLKSIAASNGNVILSSFSTLVVSEEPWNADVFAAFRMLWEKRWAFQRLAAVMTAAFGVGLVYYGMPLGVGSLGSNLYISVAITALAEVPSSLVTFFLIQRLNRRSSSLLFTSVSGGCSVLCVFLRSARWRMAAEVVSFFCACTAFNVLLIYSIELFPTSVRNSAISMVRQALVFGGAWAPVLVAAGRKGGGVLSFGVFGLVIGWCGLFVGSLPETRGRGISDTLEEQEHKERSASSSNNPGRVY